MLCTELEFISPQRVKIGHGGTLDSQATGVLPVGLGTGCTLLKDLLHTDKVDGQWNLLCQLCLFSSYNVDG